MKNLSKTDKNEILDYLKQKTGANGLIVLMSDSTMPCEEEENGGICTKGHKGAMLTSGIGENYLISFLEQSTKQLEFKNSVVSPFNL